MNVTTPRSEFRSRALSTLTAFAIVLGAGCTDVDAELDDQLQGDVEETLADLDADELLAEDIETQDEIVVPEADTEVTPDTGGSAEGTDAVVSTAQTLSGPWYRLQTMFQGDDKCLEGNDPDSWYHGGNAFMVPCGNYSGQLWHLVEEQWGGQTYYRFKTMFQGDDKCLEGNDPNASYHGGNAFMVPCGNYSGQLWTITEVNGWVKLRTMFQGPNKCLEGNDPSSGYHGGNAFMDDCGNYSGQYWQLVEQ